MDHDEVIDLFHNFVVDFLIQCSKKNDFEYEWSFMNELSRITELSVNELFNDCIGYLDFEPESDHGIPKYENSLMIMMTACTRYIENNPSGSRTAVHQRFAEKIKIFQQNYVAKMLEIVRAVFPVMKQATEINNAALLRMASKEPTIFWTCFWERTTNLVRLFELDDKEEKDDLALQKFLENPIRQVLTDKAQFRACRAALQNIIDAMEKRRPADRILNYHSQSFNEALRITGLVMMPHHASLMTESTHQSMGGVPTRRSAAAQMRSDLVFYRV